MSLLLEIPFVMGKKPSCNRRRHRCQHPLLKRGVEFGSMPAATMRRPSGLRCSSSEQSSSPAFWCDPSGGENAGSSTDGSLFIG
ncbi:hypothetical protein HPP92_000602 [Vanilla planifolia]|uniref:Uncharacterized protein n=1 Tax=Vanilla planifolia TaxID=51239 RepID=A0A835VGS4_VANPL|nr:hypothetical protein HPP92_000602 [Vanilla planifolia]